MTGSDNKVIDIDLDGMQTFKTIVKASNTDFLMDEFSKEGRLYYSSTTPGQMWVEKGDQSSDTSPSSVETAVYFGSPIHRLLLPVRHRVW